MQRRAVRFPVRFWRQDDVTNTFVGVVTNVSAGGVFISTRQVLRPNVPVEIEMQHEGKTLTLSAQVVHAARYPPLYQQVFKSGMGIRFKQPDDAGPRYVAQLGVLISDHGGRRKFPRVG